LTAAELNIGQRAVVTGLADDEVALRLLDLGIRIGKPIKLRRRSLWGHTVYLEVDRTAFALRKGELRSIFIHPTS